MSGPLLLKYVLKFTCCRLFKICFLSLIALRAPNSIQIDVRVTIKTETGCHVVDIQVVNVEYNSFIELL